MKISPKSFKRLINLYPPYLGAGVKVAYISGDWRELHVTMALHWFNRNAMGTHFGGSLYSMVDPHIMLLLMQLLGEEYWVWDRSASIEFVKASRKKASAVIKITDQDLARIERHTKNGDKYFAQFTVRINDADGDLIAVVNKTLYVRKKGGFGPMQSGQAP